MPRKALILDILVLHQVYTSIQAWHHRYYR